VPETLPLASITLDAAVNIREQLDEETIQWYMEVFNQLPPVIVYRWNGQTLLADGFHRYAAAERLGKREIAVEIREGSQDDAWVFAATANFRHGRNLSLLERDRAIARVYLLKPDWGYRRVSKEFKCASSLVQRIIKAQKRLQELNNRGVHPGGQYDRSKLAIASRAPDVETAGRLLERAERDNWTRDELQQAVRTVNDPSLPDTYKERLMKGTAPPVTADGRVLTGSIERIVAQAKRYDGIGTLWTVMGAIGRLRDIGVDAVVAQASPEDATSILRLLPADIRLLEEIKIRLGA